MTGTKKEKEIVTKCERHLYTVTEWFTRGGHEKATQMRCSVCLMPISLEELESKEFKDASGM